ncbi:MAG: nucleotidyl transferase AbiEii/AbiGii toxin family protein [Betaproteobacteria bacterium]|nr:nucleotidyl transferase AbiEii/AbiGii toxin family protein [Betaproteobacteria bacterium]MBI3938404.1 nucleotidyl transferase AbiEii/AbiGii toxin family protein [Betaproteobacteria bacterium]
MKTVLGAALEVQRFLSHAGERFCFIGGIALQRWGEPRLTRDVDVTLLSPFGEEGRTADRLLAAFRPRIGDAREFAVRNRVLLIESDGGIAVDIAFGAIPFEEHCVARSSEWALAPGAILRTCSAEDLVVLKAFASRPQDWLDIESVAIRQRSVLDWNLIFEELQPLASVREVPGLLDRLRQLRDSFSRHD